MTRIRPRGEEIRSYILENVQTNPSNISKLAAERFMISRQAVNGHLSRLVREGALRPKGATRAKSYELAPLVEWQERYSLQGSPQPSEDFVWRTDIEKLLGPLPDNVRNIWQYGFTEMFNNAVDHSEGSWVWVYIEKTAVSTQMIIADDGVGIFRKIQKAMNLEDQRHALLELTKGKLTTDPDRHTGEGIFFTSRVFDSFDILSGGVFFNHEFGKDYDWLAERVKPADGGTAVFMRLSNHTARTTAKIFDEYTDGEGNYGFNKTVVPVNLAQYGNDQLISRSQAKRVMSRVELFSKVLLDFANVPTIGQAFADEVFRVFAAAHPQIEIVPINTSPEVAHMILRAERAAHEDRGAKPSSSDG